MRRLAFIRYLYDLGRQQSLQPEPMCAIALLNFHDAVEMFLHLACEHLDAKPAKEFLGYWDCLKDKVEGGIAQKASMERLNKARVALKHSGILPSKTAVAELSFSTEVFFVDNTTRVFGLEFSEISLIDLVACLSCRAALRKAVECQNQGDGLVAMDNVALAFQSLVDDYENRKRGRFGQSPFFFGKDFTFQSSRRMGITDRELAEFLDMVKDSIGALQRAMKSLSLGLDYRRYCRFRTLVPVVSRVMSGNYVIDRVHDKAPIEEEFRFCMDFVIDSAIVLQSSDYDIPAQDLTD